MAFLHWSRQATASEAGLIPPITQSPSSVGSVCGLCSRSHIGAAPHLAPCAVGSQPGADQPALLGMLVPWHCPQIHGCHKVRGVLVFWQPG